MNEDPKFILAGGRRYSKTYRIALNLHIMCLHEPGLKALAVTRDERLRGARAEYANGSIIEFKVIGNDEKTENKRSLNSGL